MCTKPSLLYHHLSLEKFTFHKNEFSPKLYHTGTLHWAKVCHITCLSHLSSICLLLCCRPVIQSVFLHCLQKGSLFGSAIFYFFLRNTPFEECRIASLFQLRKNYKKTSQSSLKTHTRTYTGESLTSATRKGVMLLLPSWAISSTIHIRDMVVEDASLLNATRASRVLTSSCWNTRKSAKA